VTQNSNMHEKLLSCLSRLSLKQLAPRVFRQVPIIEPPIRTADWKRYSAADNGRLVNPLPAPKGCQRGCKLSRWGGVQAHSL